MTMKEAIIDILDRKLCCDRQPDGTFCYEIYADYRDEMEPAAAFEILQANEPMDAFYDKMFEWYEYAEWELLNELESEVKKELTSEDGLYPNGFTGEEEEEFSELMQDLVYFSLPMDHYLKQTFPVNIMLDTGDGNTDFVLNSVYPCWYGEYNERIDNRAGIVWLAKSQGYTKTALWKALRKGDMADPKGFLESMRVELANLPSGMSTITFLVEMTLEELIELNRLIRLQDRNGHQYDTRKNPYCGYIELEKNTMTGLYDPWSGGGSCFEIELEKDVRIPIKYIRSALPDGGDGYSVDSVYGMCGSAWRQGSVKHIHAPKKAA